MTETTASDFRGQSPERSEKAVGDAGSTETSAHDWVIIPAGPFVMGDNNLRKDGRPTASFPAHEVYVDNFRIARRPVSVSDFARFVDATSYRTTAELAGASWVWLGGEHDRQEPEKDLRWFEVAGASWRHPAGADSDVAAKAEHPVTHVSRTDCLEYCRWSGTRLPTEAEWEKAARGTDERLYPWGNTPPTASICNHSMNVGDTTAIGTYPEASGPFGLEDVAGNVWEWTSTGWHRYPFDKNKTRTIMTKHGARELGVIRGGSFFNDCDPGGVAATARVYSLLDYSSYDVGFRVCSS